MQVVMGSLPHQWKADTVILYGMFVFKLQTTSQCGNHQTTIASYITDLHRPIINLLLMRYIYCLTLQDVMKTLISNCLNKTEETKGKSSTP